MNLLEKFFAANVAEFKRLRLDTTHLEAHLAAVVKPAETEAEKLVDELKGKLEAAQASVVAEAKTAESEVTDVETAATTVEGAAAAVEHAA